MSDFAARLVAYSADGARYAKPLLDPSSWDASFAFNDAGSLQIQYARDLDPIGMLATPVEFAVELWDGSAWVESRNGRFVAVEDSSDGAVAPDVAAYTLKSYSTLLNRVTVLARPDNPVYVDRPQYTDDGEREFWTANPGQIVLSLLNEHRLRYHTLPGLIVDFTSTKDSAGQSWAFVRSLTYKPGTGLLEVLQDLASYDLVDWWMEGRILRVFNAGTRQQSHAERMNLLDATSAPVRGSWDGMATVVRLEGKDGQSWEKTVPGALAAWGPKVRTIANNSVADEATALSILDNEAMQAAGKRVEYTRTLCDFRVRPLVDFQVGDTVTAQDAAGLFADMRVYELSLSVDADGMLQSVLTLNDRFVDSDVRFQRMLKGVTSGADNVGGDGSIPNNLTPAVPAQVQGLTVGTLGYWAEGVARSSVQADWADVEADTNGYAIELLRYDVDVNGRTTMVAAADIGQDPVSTVGVDNLDIGVSAVVRVRAVSATGVAGAWSSSQTVTTVGPNVPLDRPTVPTVSAPRGVILVDWDGNLVGSGVPYAAPKRLKSVQVQIGPASTGPWTVVGELLNRGYSWPGEPTGETRWVRLVARQFSGPDSLPSDAVSVVVQRIPGSDIVAGSVTSDLFSTTAAFEGSGVKIDRNGVVVTRPDGQSVKVTSDGVAVVDSDGTDLVRLGYGVQTGLAIRNPRDGSYIPLTDAAFGQKTFYASNTTGDWVGGLFHGSESDPNWLSYDSTYDCSVSFTTTSSGRIIVDVSGWCYAYLTAGMDGTSGLTLGWGWEILQGSTVAIPTNTGRAANLSAVTRAVGSLANSLREETHGATVSRRTILTLTPNTSYTIRSRRWKRASVSGSSSTWDNTRAGLRDSVIVVTTDGY